ncbi:hypothetical protein E2605_18890 [Dysgonomonas capnocytophagoides]|uniref:Uncharacterized protein n=1 Tax=Dysgonomonas capnocytophagoides TaxID=45254 RepID=A0A4Y8KX92_9BACT|nr:hypothetical protein [Dysgonomonas capnocytophagoides]TFD92173.1 hypothetical protein E2605_18890 [Dysgonomonas capnocytophagoides]
MGLSKLINNQTISIDNHIPGSQMLWSTGIHVHKKMNDFSDISADIRIPLSNSQDYTIEIKNNRKKGGKKQKERKLYSEICKALQNKEKRELFVKEVLDWMKDNCIEDNGGKVESISIGRLMECAKRLAKHFDLSEMVETANELLRDEITTKLKSTFKDRNGKNVYMIQDIEGKRILIGDDKDIVDNWDSLSEILK